MVAWDLNIELNEWALRAGLISCQLNLEFDVLTLIMVDNHTDNSTSIYDTLVSLNINMYTHK